MRDGVQRGLQLRLSHNLSGLPCRSLSFVGRPEADGLCFARSGYDDANLQTLDNLSPSGAGPLNRETIYYNFRKFLWDAGISHGGLGKGPQIQPGDIAYDLPKR